MTYLSKRETTIAKACDQVREKRMEDGYNYTPEQIKELEDAIATQPWGRRILKDRDQLQREAKEWESAARSTAKVAEKIRLRITTERNEAVGMLQEWMTPSKDHDRTKFRLQVLNLLKRIGIKL